MPLKVLNLISSPFGLGGAEKLLLDMAEFYDRERVSVYYCNLFGSPQKISLFSEALDDGNLPKLDVAGHCWHSLPQIVSQLSGLIKNNNFDIVHTHLFHASIIGSIVGKLTAGNHRTIVTQHHTRSALSKFYQKKIDRIAVRLADRVIAISSAVKDDLLAQGVREDRIRIIPNGINLAEFDREAGKENHLLDDLKRRGKYIIGSVGNLHKRKDHFTLICGMEKIVKIFPNAHLVVVGEGAERAFLEETIKAKNLEASVSLLGFQKGVPSLIDKFDLYVHSSIFEPFGIAILEAMAACKGVIATEVDGVVDIIENELNGFLIPPQNPQAMADSIIRAIENPQQLGEIGRRGRRRVAENFRIEKTTEGYQKLYEEIA